MTFKNPVFKRQDRGQGGNFIRTVFLFDSVEVDSFLTFESAAQERNGAHFFYSRFFAADSLEAYPKFQSSVGLNPLFQDSNYLLNFQVDVDLNGRIAENETANGIDFAVAGDPAAGVKLRFGKPIGTNTIRRLNCDLQGKWVWVAFYYDPDVVENCKFFLNGLECTQIGGNESQSIDYTPATSGTIFHAVRGYRDASSISTAYGTTGEWFGSAIDGSVIGQPGFLQEFVNTDGTAKDLGNGTVQGIVPHFYFTGASGAEVNEVDGRRWDRGGTTTEYDLTATEEDTLSYYRDPTRSYMQCLVSSNYIYNRVKTNAVDVGASKLFFSFFVKNQSQNGNVTNWRYTIALAQNGYFYLDMRGIFNSGTIFASRGVGADYVTYDASGTNINNGLWQYCSLYLDVDAPEEVFIRNGVQQTLVRGTTTGSAVGDTNGMDFFGMLASGTNTFTSNFVVFDQSQIDANPGVSWNSPTLWENFVDVATGRPKDIGVDGSLALGVKPRIYLNGALGTGASGGTAAGECVSRQQSNYSVGSPAIQIADTRSFQEDVIVTLP